MLNAMRVLGLTSALIVLLAGCSLAADQDRFVVATSAEPIETRTYKVVVAIKGKMPAQGSAQPIDLDTVYTLRVRHKYGRRESDGLMPLEISVTDGKLVSSGESLSVTSGMFPKITLLLQRDWRPSGIFGITGTRYEKSIPGINYVNMILLFYLYGGDKPHAVGDKWDAKVKLPSYRETYDFTNTLKAVDRINGVETAAVHQEISWTLSRQSNTPSATVKAAADSSFALANGKLIKSRARSEVLFRDTGGNESSGQETKASRANISIDISLVD